MINKTWLILSAFWGLTAAAASGSVDDPILGAPPHGAKVEAPAFTWGNEMCHKLYVWVLLKDGRLYRIDKDYAPKSPADMDTLVEWLKTGPTDIQLVPCAAEL